MKYRSVRHQLYLYLIAPLSVVFALSFVLLANYSIRFVNDNAIRHLNSQAVTLLDEFDHTYSLAVSLVKNLRVSQESGLFEKREYSEAMLQKLILEFTNITGVYIGYEPTIDQDQAYLNKYPEKINLTIDSSGRFLPYYYKDYDTGAVVIEALRDMAVSDYYQLPKRAYEDDNATQVFVHKPYSYYGTYLIEFTQSIIIDDVFRGIVGVDIQLSFIERLLRSEGDEFEKIVLDPTGRVLASNLNTDYLSEVITTTPYGDIYTSIQESKMIEKVSPLGTQSKMIYVLSESEASGWAVLLGVEKSRVINEVRLLYTIVFIAVLLTFLVLLFIARGFAIELSSRITNVNRVLRLLSIGDTSSPLDDTKENIVEMKLLDSHINNLINGQTKLESSLVYVAEGNYQTEIMPRSEKDTLSKAFNNMIKAIRQSQTELLEKNELLVKTQRELLETEKIAGLGRLVSGVSHEINTPLGNAIVALSYLEDLHRKTVDSFSANTLTRNALSTYLEEAKESIVLMTSGLNRASELVKSFKKISVDQTSKQFREIDIIEYTRDIFNSFRHQFKLMNVEYRISSIGTERPIYTEPGAIAQMFTNLVENTLVHAFEGRGSLNEISVTIEFSDRIIVSYSDNGSGVDNHFRASLFEPFFTTKRGKGGSGLGLSIVYNLVTQLLKGKIVLDDSIEHGLGFIITLDDLEY